MPMRCDGYDGAYADAIPLIATTNSLTNINAHGETLFTESDPSFDDIRSTDRAREHKPSMRMLVGKFCVFTCILYDVMYIMYMWRLVI